jgi:hypothetical protein
MLGSRYASIYDVMTTLLWWWWHCVLQVKGEAAEGEEQAEGDSSDEEESGSDE